MKRMIAALCSLCACVGMLSAQDKGGFRVKIHLEEPQEGKILVSERVPDTDAWFIDTLRLRKGRAVYTGKVKDPRLTTFIIQGGNGEDDFLGNFTLFLDNSDIKAEGRTFKDVVVTGSPATDEYYRIEREGKDLFKRYGNLKYECSKAFGDNSKRDSLASLAAEAYERLFEYVTHVPGYAASKVIPFYISEYFQSDTEKLEKALSLLSPVSDGNIYVKSCRAELARRKKTAIGQPAHDFCLQDIQGRAYRLSDYSGKYVLVEFSASWCGWCKKEIPFLKQVYEEHKDDERFAMFTINLDDRREKWVEDVKEYDLPWPVISDLKAFKSEVADAYNIHGIPAVFLIDPQGRIAYSGLRGKEMIRTVRRCLYEMNTFACRIDGRVDGLQDGWAFLYAPDNRLLDSCRVAGGAYTLTGRMEKPCRGVLAVQTSDKQHVMMSYVYMEEGTMQAISKKADRGYRTDFVNAPVQAELEALEREFKASADYKEYDKLSRKIQEEYMKKSNASAKLKKAQREAVFRAFSALLDKSGRSRSEALTCLLDQYSALLDLARLEALCGRFDASLADSYYLSAMRAYLESEKKLAEGREAPSFQAQDLQGKTYALADFRGKYVFLEFSASWCGWCKKEIPYIRKAYEKLKDENIVFVTMMMDDKRSLWQGEVRKYDIPWLTLSDLKGIRDSEIAKAYNVSGIPASFVISPDGRIVARDLRGDEVMRQLSRLVK